MCGIAGIFDLRNRQRVDPWALTAMTETLVHRGPDSSGHFTEGDVGLGARRLRIIDLESGDQPIFNEDRSVVMVCNGEIFNYRELRKRALDRGHRFRTRTDIEVIVHLYEELGDGAVELLNGQFAFALYDRPKRRLLLARDHFGINPLHFATFDGLLLFGSEIKAILKHPAVERRVDLIGLDQVVSLPGLVGSRTLFQGIESLPSGQLLSASGNGVERRVYWDLDYPLASDSPSDLSEGETVERLRELFTRSVERRLQADVPVGVFVSGGLDSAAVAAMTARLAPSVRHSFSVTFDDEEIDEARFQRQVARAIGTEHHEIPVDRHAIGDRLSEMVFHCECPVKESFNTCALQLSEATRSAGVVVALAGEGADELFGGYPGYRFDAHGARQRDASTTVDEVFEEELRERLWGDPSLFYEKDHWEFRESKAALYSAQVNGRLAEADALSQPLVDHRRVVGRHPIHQRSYLDFKLRLAEHLLSEHGDRMAMANSVEARYPFLDVDLVDFARSIPPWLKVNGYVEKYVVRRMAEGLVPPAILRREKFGFRAPGTPFLLQGKVGWVADLLSFEETERRGYFDAGMVERLRTRYSQPGFRLHPHLETDLLMVVLTHHLLCDRFSLPPLG